MLKCLSAESPTGAEQPRTELPRFQDLKHRSDVNGGDIGTGFRFPIRLHMSSGYGSGEKSIATPLMQYLKCVGGGPSGNTWPRWLPQRLQCTSVRTMP
jgi:hypothetical protein